jgi:hypothetical protein
MRQSEVCTIKRSWKCYLDAHVHRKSSSLLSEFLVWESITWSGLHSRVECFFSASAIILQLVLHCYLQGVEVTSEDAASGGSVILVVGQKSHHYTNEDEVEKISKQTL